MVKPIFLIIIICAILIMALFVILFKKHQKNKSKVADDPASGIVGPEYYFDELGVGLDIRKVAGTDQSQSRKIKHVNQENNESIEYIEANEIKFLLKQGNEFLDDDFWVNMNDHKFSLLFEFKPILNEKKEIEAVVENINNLEAFLEEKKENHTPEDDIVAINRELENIHLIQRDFFECIRQYIISCYYFYQHQLNNDLNNNIENNDIGDIEKNFRNNMLKINYQTYNSYYLMVQQPKAAGVSRFNKIYLPAPTPIEVDKY